MEDLAQIRLTARAVKEMNEEQWKALRDNVVRDGMWETAPLLVAWWDWETLMVSPCDADDHSLITIGIEKDGYTHS